MIRYKFWILHKVEKYNSRLQHIPHYETRGYNTSNSVTSQTFICAKHFTEINIVDLNKNPK